MYFRRRKDYGKKIEQNKEDLKGRCAFKIGLLVTSGDPGAGEESERAAGVVRSGQK